MWCSNLQIFGRVVGRFLCVGTVVVGRWRVLWGVLLVGREGLGVVLRLVAVVGGGVEEWRVKLVGGVAAFL